MMKLTIRTENYTWKEFGADDYTAHEDGDLTVEKDGEQVLCISRGKWEYVQIELPQPPEEEPDVEALRAAWDNLTGKPMHPDTQALYLAIAEYMEWE